MKTVLILLKIYNVFPLYVVHVLKCLKKLHEGHFAKKPTISVWDWFDLSQKEPKHQMCCSPPKMPAPAWTLSAPNCAPGNSNPKPWEQEPAACRENQTTCMKSELCYSLGSVFDPCHSAEPQTFSSGAMVSNREFTHGAAGWLFLAQICDPSRIPYSSPWAARTLEWKSLTSNQKEMS